MEVSDTFSEAVLQFKESENSSNWEKAVSRGLSAHGFDEVPYPTTQFMEKSVLAEVALLNGLTERQVLRFEYSLETPAKSLKWLLDEVQWATPVQRINLAACLASTARYEVAEEVLGLVQPDRLFDDQKFSYLMLKFAIENRLETGVSHTPEFSRLKDMASVGRLKPSQILDASGQAIVWHIKTGSLTNDLFTWFQAAGLENATKMAAGDGQTFREMISLSCFWRAHAMIPGQAGDAERTREEMKKAELFARNAKAQTKPQECTATDAIKTVLESSLKEYQYLRKDLDGAERIGLQLIELDPNWSVSYHELASVYSAQGRLPEALNLYRKAATVGMPRRSFSEFMIGSCLAEIGDIAPALDAFEATLRIDDTNVSAALNGHKLASSHAKERAEFFDAFLRKWDEAGLLTKDNKEFLAWT
ncbi:tetratricopeptide repeat protein [Agrobacterium tumefaciens]|uniref:tetratricopeptide repeat protein n=1 Tax=Agrobacterium tumefaciens TaxID=358 RepID=UPI000AF0AD3D